MTGYIKTRGTFELYRSYPAISWDLPVASYQAATGTVVLQGMVPAAVKDMWLLLDGSIWTIERVEPSAGLTTLTIAPGIDAFDRPLLYPEAVPETAGGFIAMALLQEYRDQPDSDFSLPYLQVRCSDNAPFVRPEVSDAGLFSLPEYIRSVHDITQVRLFTSGYTLHAEIFPASLKTHTVLMDGTVSLQQQTYSRQFTAKVTVVQSTGATNFYVDANGAVSAQPPADRPKGEWRVVEARDNVEALEAAQQVFSENIAANKIAFSSPERYGLGDIIRTRLDGMAAELKITAIQKTSSDSRWHYECGELQTSLSERLRAAESIESLGGVSASGGSVKGNLGVKGRLSAGGGMDVVGPLRAEGDLNVNGILALSEEVYGYILPTTNLKDGRLFFLLEDD